MMSMVSGDTRARLDDSAPEHHLVIGDRIQLWVARSADSETVRAEASPSGEPCLAMTASAMRMAKC